MPGSVHSGSASWDDCGQMFSDKLRVSSFPDRFPHYVRTAAWSAHSDCVGSMVYACLGVTCHLHFWQNDRGLLRVTAVIRGWNGYRIRVSTQSLTLQKKILPPLLPGFELATFWSSPALYQAIAAPEVTKHSFEVLFGLNPKTFSYLPFVITIFFSASFFFFVVVVVVCFVLFCFVCFFLVVVVVVVYPSSFQFTRRRHQVFKALVYFVILSSFVIYCGWLGLKHQKKKNCHRLSSIGDHRF